MSHNDAEEISLDPADWSAFARVAHEALDAAIASLQTVSDRPPWRPLTPEARDEIREPIPREPTDLADVFAQFQRAILPFPTGNAHPRFWGWVMGNGTAEGMIADMLASAMNPHVGGYDQSAPEVEHQVITWLTELMGYPPEASGILVSGGTVANLHGLTVARWAKAGFDIRNEGLVGEGRPRLRVYGSDETHSWADKCCELLGLGRRGFRRIASDHQGRIEIERLRAAIHQDRTRGERPFCVIATAGTVDAGAIDDLDALADLCAEEDLWLHVDGAFGALLALVPALRHRLKGLERADSIAFDLHKWGFLQYEVGCTLVRDPQIHRATFETSASYLAPAGRGILPQSMHFCDHGLQLSRSFRALKVWMSFKTHGVDRIGRVIQQNVAQARYLADRVEVEPRLELLAPVPLNVVCFRFVDQALDALALDDLNREILLRLQEEGVAIPSSTRRKGRFTLRLAITNHRSRLEDFDILVESVLKFGEAALLETLELEPASAERQLATAATRA